MEKNLDSKGRWRNKIVAFRVSPEEAEQIDACVRLSGLSKQVKERQGVTEELKLQNQMAWVGRMNNIRACAEEIVLMNVVYMN